MHSVSIIDPTLHDKAGAVRGIGRYVAVLKEALPHAQIVTSPKEATGGILINPFIPFFSPPLINRRYAKRQIGVIHDVIPLQFPRYFPSGIRGTFNKYRSMRALKYYDFIITDSEASKNEIHRLCRISLERIKVIYPAISSALTHSSVAPALTEPSQFLLYVGDATWNKNIVTMGRAVLETPYVLVVAGKVFTKEAVDHPWNKELLAFQELAHSNKQIILAGYVSDGELAWLYKNASLNILLSRAEGFGYSYVEASSCNTPSLLADIPVLREVSGNRAFFSNNNSVDEIARHITTLMTDTSTREHMGTEAHEWCQRYSITTFSQLIQQVIL